MVDVVLNLSNTLKKIDEKLTRIEEAAVAALLFTMTVVIFMSVLERFFLKMGLAWIEEFSRYLSVWGAFIGASLAAKKGAHIGIEAFVQILPPRAKKLESILVSALELLFSVVVLIIGAAFLRKLAATGQISPAMRINIVWAYAAVPAGCGLMGIHYFIKLVSGISDFAFGDETKGGA